MHPNIQNTQKHSTRMQFVLLVEEKSDNERVSILTVNSLRCYIAVSGDVASFINLFDILEKQSTVLLSTDFCQKMVFKNSFLLCYNEYHPSLHSRSELGRIRPRFIWI